jgi:UDP-N-acetylglucosamine 2-epimerase (non-hydrolysing)
MTQGPANGPRRGSVLVVVGTRPEAVKLLSVVRELGDRAVVAHTGQHYDERLWGAVSQDLGLPAPGVRIEVGGSHRGVQIGTATAALTRHLLEEQARGRPIAAVVVQGDTNSTLAGALAANATGTLLVHIEAGLRSDDLSMPEESNRLLVDRIADVCCAPAATNVERLRAEGVRPDRIVLTGNTLFDALDILLPAAADRLAVLERFGVSADSYVLATMHRVSNIEDDARLRELLTAFAAIAERLPLILPMHPHTRNRAERARLMHLLDPVQVVAPLSPVEFLALEAEAHLIVSDSGGVQEEACFLRRPLLVLRDSTERPELLDGWCRLLGDQDPTRAMTAALDDAPGWRAELVRRPTPYPAEPAGARIVAEIARRCRVDQSSVGAADRVATALTRSPRP